MTRSRVKNDFAVGLTTDSAGRLTTDHTITSGGSIVVGTDGSVTGSEGAQIDLRGNDGTTNVYYFDVAGTPEVARIFTVTDDTDLQIGQLGGTGGDVQFFSGGSRKARFDSDGLKFNNDTAAANALDDYEEGTWSPTISSSGTPPTISAYTRQTGRYTKIGNTVRFQLFIEFTCTAIGTGLAYVSLPFNCISGDSYSAVSVAFNNVFTIGSTDHFGAYTESNQDQVYFTSNATLLNIGTTGSGLRLIMGGVYETA